MKILTTDKNEDFLRTKSKEISASRLNEPQIISFINKMTNHLVEKENGAGLSAVQIGKHFRIFAIKLFKQNPNNPPIEIFINPKVSLKGEVKSIREEGCLSIPGTYKKVPRYKRVRVKYLTPEGKEKKENFSGYEARIIQHELDHLNGILFIDKTVE